MSWLTGVRKLLAGTAKPEKPAVKEENPKADAGDIRAAMKEIRGNLRRVGAVLAAGATALLGGLGYAQLHHVFPAPSSHPHLVPALAAAGALSALIGAGWLIRLIFVAQRQIPIASDDSIGILGQLDDEEQKIRLEVFESISFEYQQPSLRALELQARKHEQLALESADETTKATEAAKAARLNAAVRGAALGAAGLILERRSANTFRGVEGIAAFLLVVGGIVLAFGAADYSKGQRDLIALRKSCAEAAEAGARNACEGVVDVGSNGTGTGTNGETVAKKAQAISVAVRGARERCTVRVRVNGKRTDAAAAGASVVTITDDSQTCGVRISGAGLSVRSGWRHEGMRTHEVTLKPISYAVAKLWVRGGSTPTEQTAQQPALAVAPPAD